MSPFLGSRQLWFLYLLWQAVTRKVQSRIFCMIDMLLCISLRAWWRWVAAHLEPGKQLVSSRCEMGECGPSGIDQLFF